MRKSRFDEAQIIGVLREQEAGATTEEVCRRHGVSQQTFYRWKAKYGGLGVLETRPFREARQRWERKRGNGSAEAEAARRREPAAEEAAGGVDAGCRLVEGPAGKKLITPAARRAAALRLVAEGGYSQRRACGLIEVDPKTVRRVPGLGDAVVRERLRGLAGRAAALWLSTARHSPRARGYPNEQEEAVPALS